MSSGPGDLPFFKFLIAVFISPFVMLEFNIFSLSWILKFELSKSKSVRFGSALIFLK